MYAEIIIPLSLPKNYTWLIPDELIPFIQIGVRVEVNLGKFKKYAGIVNKISNESPTNYIPKNILGVIDEQPIIHKTQLIFWKWLSEYYMCSMGEIMQIALPPYLKFTSETSIVFNESVEINPSELSDDMFFIVQLLQNKNEMTYYEIQKIFPNKNISKIIHQLILKGYCFTQENLTNKFKVKVNVYIYLDDQYSDQQELEKLFDLLQNKPKQLAVLLAYLSLSKKNKDILLKELVQILNNQVSGLNALIKKGVFVKVKKEESRLSKHNVALKQEFILSEQQQEIYTQIIDGFTEKNVYLLHGITGSGKTEIYIKLIEHYLAQAGQILLILPEIAITTQIANRLKKYFSEYIAIYHSKISSNERTEIWEKVLNDKVKIILGARSALFLPFTNLKFIIIDEEHDYSYKQTNIAPRYNAKDAAIYYANLLQIKILLGSATPSLETMYQVKSKKYGYAYLNNRYNNVKLPTIEIIDTKQLPLREKMFSTQFVEAIEKTLLDKKQVIIFHNRRGYAPYYFCSKCNFVPNCKYCNVSLTYHKFKNKLSCHYCGTQYAIIKTCSACGSASMEINKFGTEQLEEAMQIIFPLNKIKRMDIDTMKGKNDYQNIINEFENDEIDILIGTQMVVKGLDFNNVGLVGIVDADNLFKFTDFRVSERAFQLIEQVSGRAGRKESNSNVLIQTKMPENRVLQFVKQHNYIDLYEFEIKGRELFNFPPFYRLILLSFKHKDMLKANNAAVYFKENFKSITSLILLGPSEPPINRIKNLYICNILVKIKRDSKYLNEIKKQILQLIEQIKSETEFKQIQMVIDVDVI